MNDPEPRTPFELPPGPDRWWFLTAQGVGVALGVLCRRILPAPYSQLVFAASTVVLVAAMTWLLLGHRRRNR